MNSNAHSLVGSVPARSVTTRSQHNKVLLEVGQNRVSTIERGELDRIQLDTLRRYVDAVGGTLRIEVELGDDRFQIA